jgi:predicted DNA-binding transcriptional regulator AlpA
MLQTAEFVASELGISLQRVYAMARSDVFPPGVVVRFGSRQIRFHEERMREWIAVGGSPFRRGTQEGPGLSQSEVTTADGGDGR